MNELFGLLKGIAPTLATAVAGPLGGMAITALASKFGVSDSVDAVAKAIAGDPQAAEKLQEAELEFAKLENEDRASARHMQETALNQTDNVAKHFVYYFAWAWSGVSALYFFCVTFITMPDGARDFANIILGFLLGTAISSVFNFFYGSSKSSADKTNALVKGMK